MITIEIALAHLPALLGVFATAIVAAAETAVGLLGRGRPRRLAEAHVRGAADLERLADRPWRVWAAHALLAGFSFALFAATSGWAFAVMLPAWPAWTWVVFAMLASSLVVFFLGEALPRAIAVANPEDVGLAVSPAARRLVGAFYPAARALNFPWKSLVALITGEPAPDVPWIDEDAMRGFEGDEGEEGEPRDEDFMEAVSDLGGKIVREVMVPRTDMVSVEDTATVNEAITAITSAGLSRLPVYHETLDDIRGIVFAKDLLACINGPDCETSVAAHLRPALFVPETKPVDELLAEMRSRSHIAIVADEYGGTSGLVTMEDLLEEIVGEIYDEYDPQVQMVVDLGAGRYRVDARLPIDDWDERFGTDLEDIDADTAGGLVGEVAGHIPQVGESISIEGLRVIVDEMEGNRVRQLIVEPAPVTDEEGNDA